MAGRALARIRNALGLELLAGLAVLTVSAWLFGAIADEVADQDTGIDQRFADWLHLHATENRTDLFTAITRLGNVSTLLVVVGFTAVWLWVRRRFQELTLLIAAFVGAEILTVGLKLGFRRERPFFADPLASESSYSFPSGHSSVSLAVYGTIGFILARHLGDRRAQIGALVAAALLIVLIGFSRLYLGVHFLTDVIAGFSLGLAWVAGCVVALHLRLRLKARQTSRYRASA
jgi:membrane-associated phospholipid phosphatase